MTNEVRRFSFNVRKHHLRDEHYILTSQTADGEYVFYSDYATLEAERDRLSAQNALLEQAVTVGPLTLASHRARAEQAESRLQVMMEALETIACQTDAGVLGDCPDCGLPHGMTFPDTSENILREFARTALSQPTKEGG